MSPLKKLPVLLLFILPVPAIFAAAPAPAPAPAPDAKPSEPVKRHPLRGVITGLMAERSAVLVRHEEVPGVMRAMTMMFKVDAATLNRIKGGETITGLMSRQGDNWVLEDVKIEEKKG